MKIKRLFSITTISILTAALVLSACGTSAATPQPEPASAPTTVSTAEPTAIILPEPAAASTAAPALEFVHSILGGADPLSRPVAVALDAQDNLYVLEAGSGRDVAMAARNPDVARARAQQSNGGVDHPIFRPVTGPTLPFVHDHASRAVQKPFGARRAFPVKIQIL